jgi:hypothetical protein
VGAASLLLVLGVPDDLVMQEYLLTNRQLVPALQPIVDQFAEAVRFHRGLLRQRPGDRRDGQELLRTALLEHPSH